MSRRPESELNIMNTSNSQGTTQGPERARWISLLAKADPSDLEQAWESLDEVPEYDVLRAPECGLAMVRGRAGGTGAPFNLGEMTMTRCAVVLKTGETGFGYVAGRAQRHAELAALFDALLQAPERRAGLERDLIAPVENLLNENRRNRESKTAATKVDFFTVLRGEDAELK